MRSARLRSNGRGCGGYNGNDVLDPDAGGRHWRVRLERVRQGRGRKGLRRTDELGRHEGNVGRLAPKGVSRCLADGSAAARAAAVPARALSRTDLRDRYVESVQYMEAVRDYDAVDVA